MESIVHYLPGMDDPGQSID